MSYSELLKELKLTNNIVMATRVHAAEEQLSDIAGCVFKALMKVREGRTVVLGRDSCSCKGFAHNSGLLDEKPMIPGGFGLFLSGGAGRMWCPPGERFKCCPEVAEQMFANLPKDVMDGFDAIKFEPYREGAAPDVITAFVTPDQLSALIVLHGYNRGEYDSVIASTVSGCASMLRIPFSEMKKEKPRAVITGTDIAQRDFVPEEEIAISFVNADFENMLRVTDECFFHSPVWKKTRARIHKGEEDNRLKSFTMLAD